MRRSNAASQSNAAPVARAWKAATPGWRAVLVTTRYCRSLRRLFESLREHSAHGRACEVPPRRRRASARCRLTLVGGGRRVLYLWRELVACTICVLGWKCRRCLCISPFLPQNFGRKFQF